MIKANQTRDTARGRQGTWLVSCALCLSLIVTGPAAAQTTADPPPRTEAPAGAETQPGAVPATPPAPAGAETQLGAVPASPPAPASVETQPGADTQLGAEVQPGVEVPAAPQDAQPDTSLTPEQRRQAVLQQFLTTVALTKNNLGAVYFEQGAYDSAQVHLEHALEVAPGFAAAYLTLGLVHHARGNSAEALEAFMKTVEGDTLSVARMRVVPPDTVYAWARIQYDRMMAGMPNLASAHTDMAIAYNQGGYFNEAVHHYRQAIENDSTYVDAYTNLGKAYTDTEAYEQAAEVYEKVLTLHPPEDQLPRIHLNLGVSYMGLERVDDAITEWKRAVALAPDYMDAYMNLGTAYQSKNMPDSTRAVWERALEVGGQSVVPRVALARLSFADGRLDDALRYYGEILDLGARDPRISAEIGLVHERREDFEQAISNYEQALELVPENAQLKAALNRVRRIVEDREQAIESNKIRVRQIVVATQEDADALMDRLEAGADFAELARETSIDSSRDRGGDLGFFGPGEMIPEFEQAAMGLEVGELSGVVQTPMGFHIIKRIE